MREVVVTWPSRECGRAPGAFHCAPVNIRRASSQLRPSASAVSPRVSCPDSVGRMRLSRVALSSPGTSVDSGTGGGGLPREITRSAASKRLRIAGIPERAASCRRCVGRRRPCSDVVRTSRGGCCCKARARAVLRPYTSGRRRMEDRAGANGSSLRLLVRLSLGFDSSGLRQILYSKHWC